MRRTYVYLILISVVVLLFTQKINIKGLYNKLPDNGHSIVGSEKNDSLISKTIDSLKMIHNAGSLEKGEDKTIVQSIGDWSSAENENILDSGTGSERDISRIDVDAGL